MESELEEIPEWQLEIDDALGSFDEEPFHPKESKQAMLPPRKKEKVKHPLWQALVLQPLGIIEEDFPTSRGRCNLCSISLLYSTLLVVLFFLSHFLGYLYETVFFEAYDQSYRQRLEGYLVLLFIVSVGTLSMAFFTYVKIWCRRKPD